MAYPASTSAQSIISLSTTVPCSSSGQSVISLGSSTASSHYETCPSDSPPSSQRQHPMHAYSPPPPLPRPPTFHQRGERSIEEAFDQLTVGAGDRVVPREDRRSGPSSQSNKPLPQLPPPPPPADIARDRQDPQSSRYRAGSSFRTVYDPQIVPSRGRPPPPSAASTSSSAPAGGGAANLVLRRDRQRPPPADEQSPTSRGYDRPARIGADDASGRDRHHSQPTSYRPHPQPQPSTPSYERPLISSPTYNPQPPPPDRYLVPTYPNYQQHHQQPYRPSPPPPPPHTLPHQYPNPLQQRTHVLFPGHHDSHLQPPPPPDLTYRPCSSPPSLPSTSKPRPAREPSFSHLPPPSTPPPLKRPTSTHSFESPQFPAPASPSTPRPRPRAQSATPTHTPQSASARADTRVQCSGVNASSGKQCKNKKAADKGGNVRASPSPRKALVVPAWEADDGEDEGAEEEWYCHKHVAAILKNNTGCFVGGGGGRAREWVEFDDWIPPELSPSTRIALMKVMERSPDITVSSARGGGNAEQGWIYAFEYRALSTSEYRTIKIGQSKNPTARLEQWGAQCPSHEPVLLGVCPGPPPSSHTATSRLRGLRAGGGSGGGDGETKGVKGSLWLEKLVHTEIQSFDPGPQRMRVECRDCKKFHQEMFRIPRSQNRRGGDEWEERVLPVMERWERFVRMVLEED